MSIFHKIFGIKTKAEKLKQRKFEVLEDTVKYYSEDPETRRCSSIINQCYYSSQKANKPESDGCAIGRLLPEELRIELDALPASSINNKIFGLLPKDVQALELNFLSRLQSFHDNSKNWNITGSGLTFEGQSELVDFKKAILKGKI